MFRRFSTRIVNPSEVMTTIEIFDGPLTAYKPTDKDADHVMAWTKGGASNCQMLCKIHNRGKGNG